MNKPKITIVKKQPNNSSKITIVKKKLFTIPKESTYKILNIDNLRFRHVLQKTPANCGPLAIIN